jgi:hypothetical protein
MIILEDCPGYNIILVYIILVSEVIHAMGIVFGQSKREGKAKAEVPAKTAELIM